MRFGDFWDLAVVGLSTYLLGGDAGTNLLCAFFRGRCHCAEGS